MLADLTIESEAATAAAFRIARAYDEADAPFRRFATAVMKHWVCKRAPQHAIEALECLGGNGYVEESRMPRLYRDSPLNSIWEGSGNVSALDVLRAMFKEPEGLPAFLAECELARGANAHLDAAARPRHEHRAERSAVRGAPDRRGPGRRRCRPACSCATRPPAVADAFCASRLGENGGRVFGTLPAGVDADAIVERTLPA